MAPSLWCSRNAVPLGINAKSPLPSTVGETAEELIFTAALSWAFWRENGPRGLHCGDRAAPMTRLPFVARAGVMADIDAAFDAARHGRGGLWLVTGDAGIGKSRLAE